MIKKMLSSKKGASSILVILLLIVLVVFGIAALTTALSSLRLGQKVVDFNSAYYSAEGAASERFARIDQTIAEAYTLADSDITGAVTDKLSELDFDAVVSSSDGTIDISYETWSDDIGIRTVLTLDITDSGSLRVAEWKEIQ